MKRIEKELERERERNLEREAYGKRECTGRRGFLRVRRGGRRREVRVAQIPTNAGFETRVQVRTREECGRDRELRVALTREGHRRGHRLRVASIQERERRVKQMSRTRRFALRGCLDAGVRSASAIYKEKGDLEREIRERKENSRERGLE